MDAVRVPGLLANVRLRRRTSWRRRAAAFLGRSRNVALFAGLVALLGGARQAQKHLGHT
jgi:hypothetical protein